MDGLVHESDDFLILVGGEGASQFFPHVLEVFVHFLEAFEQGHVNQRGNRFSLLGDENFPMMMLNFVEQFTQVLPDGHGGCFTYHGNCSKFKDRYRILECVSAWHQPA
jgi:hypothetical protein